MPVDEFGEEVAPYILDSTPPVLSVGYRCMNLGYSFIWPKGEDPYFLLPNGSICPLVTTGDVPYLYPGTSQCQPKTSKKTRCFACICQEVPLPLCGECTIKRPGQLATTDTNSSGEECKDVKTSVASATAPAEVPEVQPAEGEQAVVDVEEKRLKLREAQAKIITQQNKLLDSKNELINSKVEINRIFRFLRWAKT